MPPSPELEPRRRGLDRGEWTYLTFDVDRPCTICEEYLRSGQAVGLVKGQLVHAKCYRGEGESPRQPSAA